MKTIYIFVLLTIAPHCCAQQPLLLPCLVGEKWGYCDTNGVLVISAEFDQAGYFTNLDNDDSHPLDVWYAPVRNGLSNNWIDVSGKRLFSFDLIDYIDCRPLNAKLRTITLGFNGKPRSKTALVNNRLQIIRSFEAVSYRNNGGWDNVDIWFDSEEQGEPRYARATYWNEFDYGQGFLIEKDSGWHGIMNLDGQTIVEPKYMQVSNLDKGKYLGQPANSLKWFLYANAGKVLDTFPYEPKTGINEGLVGVCAFQIGIGDRCGFVDLHGETKIPFKYTMIYGFNRGIAIGQRPDGGCDLFDKKGNIYFTFNSIEYFAPYPHHFFIRQDFLHWIGYDYNFRPFGLDNLEGPPLTLKREGKVCYRFKVGEDSVYVDLKGHELGRHSYDKIKQVELSTSNDGDYEYPNLYYVRKKDKWGFASRVGVYNFREIVAPKLDRMTGFTKGYSCNNIEGKWGVFDITGKIIVPFEFDNAKVTYNFLKPDSIWFEVEKNSRVGIYDKSGNLLIPCVLQEYTKCMGMEGKTIWLDSLNFINYLCDGKGTCVTFDSSYHFQPFFTVRDWNSPIHKPCFLVQKNNKSGLMDGSGNWITPPEHDQCNITLNGRYYITLDAGLWRLYERKSGKTLSESSMRFEIWGNDISSVFNRNGKNIYWLWNEDNNTFFESENRLGRCREELISYTTSEGSGFYDKNMNSVIPPKYDNVQDFFQGTAIVAKNKFSGVIDKEGQIILLFEYEYLWRFKGDYFLSKELFSKNFTLIKVGINSFVQNINSIDSLPGHRFLIGFLPSGQPEDSIRYNLLDREGNILINTAEKVFPTANSAAYIKQGKYYKLGRSENASLKEIVDFGRIRKIGKHGLLWVGIVTGFNCYESFGLQGLLTKDSIPIIPIGYQSIDLIKETGEFSVWKNGKFALFDREGKQKSDYQFDWSIHVEPKVPFCYFVTQKDPLDKSARIDWWITKSGKPICIKRKWKVR